MPKLNLSRMDVETLANLRKQVDELLFKRRADIESQLGALAALTGERGRRGRGSSLKGIKFRRNIVVRMVRRGQVEVQDPDGLLLRLRKGRSWKTLRLKRRPPEGSEEKNKIYARRQPLQRQRR